MEKYSKDYQIEMCIDWFLLDIDNIIAMFSSAGSFLPKMIAENAAENEILIDFFDKYPPFTEVKINPFLSKYELQGNDLIEEKVANEPEYPVRKGLLYFDKTAPCPSSIEISYHLIASPVEFLSIENLPSEIVNILLKRKVNFSLRDFRKIDANYIPWANLFEEYYIEPIYPPAPKKKKFWEGLF